MLFNGGVMKGEALRARLLATLAAWLEEDGAAPARVLEGADLDLAVARGAAAYGLARHGRGIRIRGGTARAYYVGIESAVPAVPGVEPPITALCLAPFGMEEGTEAQLPPHEPRRGRRGARELPLLRIEREAGGPRRRGLVRGLEGGGASRSCPRSR